MKNKFFNKVKCSFTLEFLSFRAKSEARIWLRQTGQNIPVTAKGMVIRMFSKPMDYKRLCQEISTLKNKYDFLDISSIGKSFCKRDVFCIKIGSGDKEIIYVGAHHGLEWGTSQILMQFLNNYCEAYSLNREIFGYKSRLAFSRCSIYIVPMLNPDGVDLNINGIKKSEPLHDRIVSSNGDSEEFNTWQANARGVDLNHNYDAGWTEGKLLEKQYGIFFEGPTRYGGEYPESESETSAMCNLTRAINPEVVLALHSQGREIYYDYKGHVPKWGKELATIYSRMTGYKLAVPDDIASVGGYKDWFIKEFDKPGFTIEVGKGTNPLTEEQIRLAYDEIKEMLIFTPLFV